MEIIVPLKGFEGSYSISSSGDVYSHLRGKLTPRIGRSGYLEVRPTRDGKRFVVPVHIAMAESFLGERKKGIQVCHNNGNPIDNRIENLRYGTPRDNAKDRTLHGRCWESKKKNCPLGHPLSGTNLVNGSTKQGKRVCRACGRASAFISHNGKRFSSRKKDIGDYYLLHLEERVAFSDVIEYLRSA